MRRASRWNRPARSADELREVRSVRISRDVIVRFAVI
jgi:hypothetical protein